MQQGASPRLQQPRVPGTAFRHRVRVGLGAKHHTPSAPGARRPAHACAPRAQAGAVAKAGDHLSKRARRQERLSKLVRAPRAQAGAPEQAGARVGRGHAAHGRVPAAAAGQVRLQQVRLCARALLPGRRARGHAQHVPVLPVARALHGARLHPRGTSGPTPPPGRRSYRAPSCLRPTQPAAQACIRPCRARPLAAIQS
jgi:hypothetical protein